MRIALVALLAASPWPGSARILAASALPASPPLPPPDPARQPSAPVPDSGLPPYQASLERFAELLGTLTFMRALCGADGGPDWRDRMAALIEAEGTTPERRDRLAGRFNEGFEGYRLSYHACTPAARVVVERALREGATLSAALAHPDGGD